MKTKVNSYFKTLSESNPKLAKAIKTFKSGSVYLVKNYVASVFGIAILPAIVVGGACVAGLMKYKGGKYLTNKKASKHRDFVVKNLQIKQILNQF